MHKEAKELWAFLKGIEKNPRDTALRSVFADWLEEHDEPEEALIHRQSNLKKHDAEIYLREFCKENRADYDDLLESVAAGEGYCFGSDDGPEEARGNDEFWENVRILLETDDIDTDQPFRCSC